MIRFEQGSNGTQRDPEEGVAARLGNWSLKMFRFPFGLVFRHTSLVLAVAESCGTHRCVMANSRHSKGSPSLAPITPEIQVLIQTKASSGKVISESSRAWP